MWLELRCALIRTVQCVNFRSEKGYGAEERLILNQHTSRGLHWYEQRGPHSTLWPTNARSHHQTTPREFHGREMLCKNPFLCVLLYCINTCMCGILCFHYLSLSLFQTWIGPILLCVNAFENPSSSMMATLQSVGEKVLEELSQSRRSRSIIFR